MPLILDDTPFGQQELVCEHHVDIEPEDRNLGHIYLCRHIGVYVECISQQLRSVDVIAITVIVTS